jgi:hypothetical protein
MGVQLRDSLTLETMIQRDWIKPRLRVLLPRAAFHAWTNYPVVSPLEAEGCVDEHAWALNLYVRAVVSGFPGKSEKWWLCDLDDSTLQLTTIARANSVQTSETSVRLPDPFHHARHNQEIRPWIDYFAYWQAFQIAEYNDAMTGTFSLTSQPPDDPQREIERRRDYVNSTHQRLARTWETRYAAFDWLSRMRTALGSSIMPQRTYEEVDTALKTIAVEQGLTVDQMKHDVREVLLPMWQDITHTNTSVSRNGDGLAHLLRQELQYGVHFIERISGEQIDPLDEYWSPSSGNLHVPSLIRALPHEEDVARLEFAQHVMPYIKDAKAAIPELALLDYATIRRIIDASYRRIPALGRFILAFHRFHEELRGERLTAEETVIRQAERIEQFVLIVLHAEKVLSHQLRAQQGSKRASDVRSIAKHSCNEVMSKWQLQGGGFSAVTQPRLVQLIDQRAQLHDLDEAVGLPLVIPSEVASGKPVADHIIAAFVNFVIARNYAAHHDALDFELVYPTSEPGRTHQGALVLQSVVIAVLATLTPKRS